MNLSGRARRVATGWLVPIAVCAAVLAGIVALRGVLVDAPLDRLTAEPSPDQPDLMIYRGSWYFPRGGYYKLGFAVPEGQGRAELRIDGRRVTAGVGQRDRHILYADPGPRAVELRA
ncbi:MAG: hypothetical protein AAGC55_26330, partial [Myxococcota bacterium]